MSATKADLLNMEFINSLPQPLQMREWGKDKPWWEIHDIDVQTGLMRILVCGLLQVMDMGDVAMFRDFCGNEHDPETFYTEQDQ